MKDPEPELPPLDDAIRALLDRAGGIDTPPAGVKARVRGRVVAGAAAAAPMAGPRTATPAAPDVVSWSRRLVPLAVSFVLGGGIGVVAGVRIGARTSQPSAPAPAPPPPAPAETPPPSARASDVPVAPASPVAPPVLSTPLDRPRAALGSAVAAERSLLDTARAALERGDAAAALKVVSRHERRYPRGLLVQEREAMGIRALVMLGRGDEARRRAAVFRSRFPDSVLLPAIEAALGSSGER